MRTTPQRLAAGTAVGALVASGLLFTAPAAQADSTVVIPSNRVDQSETRAAGHHVFGVDGVRVFTDGGSSTGPRTDGGAGTWNTAKASGYFDVDLDLADLADDEPALDWSNNVVSSGATNLRPSIQLKVDVDDDGKLDGTLVGEPTYADGSNLYGDNWWLTGGSNATAKAGAPSNGGGFGSSWNGTLAEWSDAFPDANILESGWSLGSGVSGDGTIYSISLGDKEYLFTSKAAAVKTLYENDVDLTSTRSTGHNVFRPTSGVRVYTEGNSNTEPAPGGGTQNSDKAAGYFPISGTLSDVNAPVLKFRNTSGDYIPGSQLEVDLDNDGAADGTLVGENNFGGLYWLSRFTIAGVATPQNIKDLAPRKPGFDSAPGYSSGAGTLSEWREVFPDAKVLQGGWSLGSGAKGDGVLESITYGTTRYEFTGANRAPSAPNATGATKVNKAVTILLDATDPDGDDLTYSATSASGDVAFVGSDLTFTPDDDYAGTAKVDYTVDDGRGGTATGTVSIKVAKSTSSTDFTRTNPTAPTSRKRFYVYATVTAPGHGVAGGLVTVTNGGSAIGKGRLNSLGKVKIQLSRKLAKGNRTITITYAGTSEIAGSKVSKKVLVK